MRKLLRRMAKVRMKQMGYSKVNTWMSQHWREIVGAYPVNLVTGKKMSKGFRDFRGKKQYNAGHYSHLFAY